MANVDSPFGFLPVRHLMGGVVRTNYYHDARNDNDTVTLFQGDPVIITSGYIERAAANNTILGIFKGCHYINSSTGKPYYGNYYDGNANSTDVDFEIWDDPNIVFKVQTTTGQTPVVTDRGDYGNMITYAAGSTTTGRSIIELDAISSSVATWRVLGLHELVGNTFAEHVVVEVLANEHLLRGVST